ncbi:hypothetical protein K505DRAFT_369464 [Melanomma pulvis-pyrius CBS 109.77]|uniref:Uncharacterized protein n=1 Tax=Melanomma pulvis-pyrius CBS 109.77 TaxID=1314802 RepID=A0A6A6WNE2_9PLEO|nr:hypothetical protein K505DRAFT_369464 [Melanomma pulvis-pyrius CBS 109.77]
MPAHADSRCCRAAAAALLPARQCLAATTTTTADHARDAVRWWLWPIVDIVDAADAHGHHGPYIILSVSAAPDAVPLSPSPRPSTLAAFLTLSWRCPGARCSLLVFYLALPTALDPAALCILALARPLCPLPSAVQQRLADCDSALWPWPSAFSRSDGVAHVSAPTSPLHQASSQEPGRSRRHLQSQQLLLLALPVPRARARLSPRRPSPVASQAAVQLS